MKNAVICEAGLNFVSHSDDRQGHTSASNAQADLLCPGRHLAQKGFPERTSKDATSGQKIHAALAGEEEELDSQQEATLDDLESLWHNVFAEWIGADGIYPILTLSEERLWITLEDRDQKPITVYKHSGKPDRAVIVGHRALICDFKTLYGDIEDASKNMQLRDLAVLLWSNFPHVTEISVFVNQPRVTHKPVLAVYGVGDLIQSLNELHDRIIASNNPAAIRVSNEVSCKFCRAWQTCPQAQQEKDLIMIQLQETNLSTLSHEKKVALFDSCAWVAKKAKDFMDQMKEEIKANPDAFPEFVVETKPGNREIKSVESAQNALAGILGGSEILELAKIPVGKLETLYADKCFTQGVCTKVAAKQNFKKLMVNVITNKTDKMEITRKENLLK